MEVRIEEADLRNTVNGQVVSSSGAPNSFRRRRIVNTKHLLTILAYVRMDPRHVIFGIVRDDGRANQRAVFVSSEIHTVRESSFN
jgi:hypothetical protein